MKPGKNRECWSFAQRKAATAELEAHLVDVLNEVGQLNQVAAEKVKLAKELLDRFGRYHDQETGQEENLPF